MSTSQILGLILLVFGFGVRLAGRFLNFESIGISKSVIMLSGLIATVAGVVIFFFLNF
ncbi:MAG: hypothetical protein HND51_14610 [Chloroflexi bacterium]|nr:hypothetical protein [Chloroflexota bacterium]